MKIDFSNVEKLYSENEKRIGEYQDLMAECTDKERFDALLSVRAHAMCFKDGILATMNALGYTFVQNAELKWVVAYDPSINGEVESNSP